MRTTALLVLVITAMPLVAAQNGDPLAAAFKASYEAETKGDLNEAYRVIYNVIGGQPSSYEGVMRLGYIKGMQNQPRDAVLLYGRAAELEAGAVEPYIYQQYQYILLGDWAGLESSAKAALTRDQHNYTARSRLGYALYMQNKFSEAAEQYVRLGRLYPLDLDVMIMRGWSYAKSGQKALAIRAFKRALTISPDNASAKEGLEFAERLR